MLVLVLNTGKIDLVDRYLGKLDRYNRLENPRTRERYRGLAAHWRAYCDRYHYAILEIGPGEIEQYIAFRAIAGARPVTINNELRFIRALYQYLADENLLPKNPTRPVPNLKPPPVDVKYYTGDQVKAMLVAADPDFREVILSFLYLGLRKTELITLEWRDIDFTRRLAWIQPKDYWRAKHESHRSIPIPDKLLPVLQRRFEQRGTARWVFQARDGRRLHRNTLQRRMVKIRKQTGILDATIHRLRHTYGTNLAMNNVSLRKIQQLMGHKDFRTTLHYAFVIGSMLHEDVNTLNFGG